MPNVGKLWQEVYAAFRVALSCGCPHDLGLGLDAILPGNDGRDTAKAIPLDIIVESGGKTQRWNRLRVQLAEDKVATPTPTNLHRPRATKNVHWPTSLINRASSSTTCVTQTTAQEHHHSYFSSSIQLGSEIVTPPPITDLCQTLQKGKCKTSASTDCVGNIPCDSRRFNLYRQACQSHHASAVRPSTLLEDPKYGGGLVKFTCVERLKLAPSLSYSVLHATPLQNAQAGRHVGA
jgi:hypothetical protein